MGRRTVKRANLSTAKMTAGNERKYSKVILDGMVKEWVGIGWIDLRKATKADRANIPEVV